MGKGPFPPQLRNTLRYNETVLISVSGGSGYYVFSCNALYDPNVTGTGHQPMYYDQLTPIYNHYTVVKSRFKCQLVNGGSVPYVMTVFKDDDGSPNITSVYTPPERTGAISRIVNSSAFEPPWLYQAWDAVQTFGPNPTANDNLQGGTTSNPVEQTYYIIHLYDAGLTTASVSVVVNIEYDTVWDELISVASS